MPLADYITSVERVEVFFARAENGSLFLIVTFFPRENQGIANGLFRFSGKNYACG